jgi:hypothetical protein
MTAQAVGSPHKRKQKVMSSNAATLAVAVSSAAAIAAPIATGKAKEFVTSALSLNVSKKGAGTSYSFPSKKSFLAKQKAAGVTTAAAKKLFQKQLNSARQETTQRAALAMLAGKLTVSKVNLKDGEISGLKFVSEAEADSIVAEITEAQMFAALARKSGRSVEEIEKLLGTPKKDATIEVQTTPVQTVHAG